MLASTNCAKAIAALAFVVPLFAAGAAEARRGVKPYYWETYETRGPVRGYEGYVAPELLLLLQTLPQPRLQRRCAGERAVPRCGLAAGADLPVIPPFPTSRIVRPSRPAQGVDLEAFLYRGRAAVSGTRVVTRGTTI